MSLDHPWAKDGRAESPGHPRPPAPRLHVQNSPSSPKPPLPGALAGPLPRAPGPHGQGRAGGLGHTKAPLPRATLPRVAASPVLASQRAPPYLLPRAGPGGAGGRGLPTRPGPGQTGKPKMTAGALEDGGLPQPGGREVAQGSQPASAASTAPRRITVSLSPTSHIICSSLVLFLCK